ncbi:MAG: DUF362 domain-containing protein [Candidatus Latescibacterota bacterium]
MSLSESTQNRRSFLRGLSAGTAGLAYGLFRLPGEAPAQPREETSAVALTVGTDRREMALEALKPFEGEIKSAIRNKQVVIKVNMGQVDKKWPYNATDPGAVQGVLDFLKPIYKRKVILAEATAASSRSTLEGFKNFGYLPLEGKYDIDFRDFNERPTTLQWIMGETGRPQGIHIISDFLNPDNYMISVTRLKSHDNILATLSLKNMVMGAPVNHWRQREYEGRNEKPLMHGGGNKHLSYNMFLMATRGVRPNLAVLDGVVGMEGSGPVSGDPIEHGVLLASMDWLAADRTGVELMGIDYTKVMYLRWCGQAGLGQDDRSKIQIIGPDPAQQVKRYRMHKNIAEQLEWIEKDGL